jgi:hypothetical protein
MQCNFVAMTRFEQFADARMHPYPARRKHLVIERLADQRVAELKMVRWGQRLDDPGRQCLFQRREDGVLGAFRNQRQQQFQRKGAADTGSDGQHASAGHGETVQALSDDLAHPDRDRREHAGVGVVEGDPGPYFGQEIAHGLHQKHRMTLGALVDRGDRGRRRRGPAGGGQKLFGLVAAQAGQAQALEMRVACEFRQGFGEGMLSRQLGFPIGAQHQQAMSPQFGGEKGQQAQRRGVGPVQIVEDQKQRPFFGHCLPDRNDGMKELEARLIALERLDRGQIVQAAAYLRHDGGDVCGTLTQHRAQAVIIACIQQSAQRLDPRPIGRGAGFLEAAPPPHLHTASRRFVGQFLAEPGLAHAGVSRQHKKLVLAGTRSVQRRTQGCQLELAADEHAASRCRRGRAYGCGVHSGTSEAEDGRRVRFLGRPDYRRGTLRFGPAAMPGRRSSHCAV